MAGDNGEEQAAGGHEPRECMACRGTGKVLSNLGGAPSEVSCPWCGGAGVRVPGIDAQAGWQAADAQETGSASESAAPPPASR